MKYIKTPLRYPGGKSRASDIIISHFPKEFNTYIEPFVGGGSVFIKLKQLYPDKNYWINDLFHDLYCFWYIMQTHHDELVWIINQWKKQYPNGKELYDFLHNNIFNFNKIERAAAFFIFNRITFSGTSLSGGYSQESFEKRFTQSSIDRIKSASTLLKNTNITNMDYIDVINSIPNNDNDTFIFLDPPYYSNKKSLLYGPNGQLHKTFDHDKLFQYISNVKTKWLITYDNSEYIKSLYKNYNISNLNFTYGMNNVSKNKNNDMNATEIIIKNY